MPTVYFTLTFQTVAAPGSSTVQGKRPIRSQGLPDFVVMDKPLISGSLAFCIYNVKEAPFYHPIQSQCLSFLDLVQGD